MTSCRWNCTWTNYYMLDTFWRLKFTQLFHSVRSRLQIWAQPQSWPRFWTLEGPPRSNGRRFARRLLDVKWSRRPPQLPRTAESERPAEPIGYQSIDCTWCNTSPLHGQTENGPKTKRPREHGTNLNWVQATWPPFFGLSRISRLSSDRMLAISWFVVDN